MSVDEHTPAPQESRGIYGFALFVMMNICTAAYFIWMLLPTEWRDMLPYEPPQPYWGLAIPIYFCTTLFLFAFWIYPAMHGLHEGDLDDSTAVTDPYSLPLNYFEEQRAKSVHPKKIKKGTIHKPQPSSPRKRNFDPTKRWTWSTKDKEDFEQQQQQKIQQRIFGADACKPIPSVSDMDLNEVCQILYLKR